MMTLNDFIDIWQNSGTAYVFKANNLEDVITSIDLEQGIPREYVAFCFDPGESQWKCKEYLNERWSGGTVEAFTVDDEGLCIFVEPLPRRVNHDG